MSTTNSVLQVLVNTTQGTEYLRTQLNFTVAEIRWLIGLLSNEEKPCDNSTSWKDLFRRFREDTTVLVKVSVILVAAMQVRQFDLDN